MKKRIPKKGTKRPKSGTPVKLMQTHSPAFLAGLTAHSVSHDLKIKPGVKVRGSLMGAGEYGEVEPRRPWQYTVADYEVRQRRRGDGIKKPAGFDPDKPWGIYLRRYNVCLAEFAPNSAALRDALARMFDAAHALKQSAIEKFRSGRA